MEDISRIFAAETDPELIQNLLEQLFTKNEIEMIRQRLKIATMLRNGTPQHAIAKEIRASLCSITRGAKMLKVQDSTLAYIVDKYLIENNTKNNETKD